MTGCRGRVRIGLLSGGTRGPCSHLRQPDNSEQDGARQHESRKESQLAQCHCRQRHKRKESPDGGEITNDQRGDEVAQRACGISFLLQMTFIMEGIVGRYADEHGSNAQHNDRKRVERPSQTPQSKEEPEARGCHNGQQRTQVAEPADESQQNEHRGYGKGQNGIAAYQTCIAYRHDGSTQRMTFNRRNRQGHTVTDLLQQSHE